MNKPKILLIAEDDSCVAGLATLLSLKNISEQDILLVHDLRTLVKAEAKLNIPILTVNTRGFKNKHHVRKVRKKIY